MSDQPAVLGQSSRNSILADANKALALCHGGSVQEGVDLYKQVLKAEYDLRRGLPVALHLRFLENMGLKDAAAAIRREALVVGQNLCLNAELGKPPREVIAEYRELLAQGIVNSDMMDDYLIELSKLGEVTELASFLDVNRFVRCVELSIGDDEMRGEKFWQAVAATLLEERSDRNWRGAVQSVRDMHLIPRLDKHKDKRVQLSLSEIDRHVKLYLQDLRTSGASIIPLLPQNYRVIPWAVISSGYGYNLPHIHNAGSVTGVLYVAGPNEIGADGYPVGALRIGPSEAAASSIGWPDLAVAPKSGTLVLFPSYFTHWTLPLGKPALRISIAFDVVDLQNE